jgi:hypothetical protein
MQPTGSSKKPIKPLSARRKPKQQEATTPVQDTMREASVNPAGIQRAEDAQMESKIAGVAEQGSAEMKDDQQIAEEDEIEEWEDWVGQTYVYVPCAIKTYTVLHLHDPLNGR